MICITKNIGYSTKMWRLKSVSEVLKKAIRLKCHNAFNKTVRIGCGSGFWGDTPTAPEQLIENGKLDFLMFDYLSELTMSLLTAAKNKNPEMGYAPDFVIHGVGPYLNDIKRQGIRVVANAGGINTTACAAALRLACKKAGVDLSIAEVHGDNMLQQDLYSLYSNVKEMKSCRNLPPRDSIHSMTAYFGAGPIVEALNMGADIVITGRTVDSALALGPLMHTYGWSLSNHDWDQLAAGSLAGHLIECGGQSTGGIFTDWHQVKHFSNLGFPIVEVSHDGSFLLTKPLNTGGLVTTATVGEQLLYEIGDPANYELPDVICDFRNVTMIQEDESCVRVMGAKGRCPSTMFKVCSTYVDGFKATAAAIIAGGDVVAKGRCTSRAIMQRTSEIFKRAGFEDFKRTHISVLGGSNCDTGVIWMAVHHNNKKAIDMWAREIASSGTGMTPGLCGIIGGRPRPTPLLRLFSFLIPKKCLVARIICGQKEAEYRIDNEYPEYFHQESKFEYNDVPSGTSCYPLETLAYARSGDKGDSCNIGVIARHPAYLPFIKALVTPNLVAEYFSDCFDDDDKKLVNVYDLPGISAINFTLDFVLGGGGMASLRPDPLGKAFAQKLLQFELKNVPTVEEMKELYKA